MPGAIRVGWRCKTIDGIEELVWQYPAPTHQKMENGPEFIAHALQAMVHSQRIQHGIHGARHTLGESMFRILQQSVPEARLLAEQYGMEYNTYRPHSSLQQWRAA